jgi:hypothetical protein
VHCKMIINSQQLQTTRRHTNALIIDAWQSTQAQCNRLHSLLDIEVAMWQCALWRESRTEKFHAIRTPHQSAASAKSFDGHPPAK